LITTASEVEILVLGNSHTAYGINPNMFSKYAFNLAFEGQTVYYDMRLLEKFLPILNRLKCVIINIDYHNLCVEDDDNRAFFYRYHFDIPNDNKFYFSEYLFQSIFVHTFKETWTIYQRDKKNNKSESSGDLKGWAGFTNNHYYETVSLLKAKFKADRFNKHAEKYRNDSNIVREFENIIQLMQKHNITPILLTCPIYKVQRECLTPIAFEEVNRVSAYLSKKYNIQYLNFQYDDVTFEVHDYYDSDHLNIKGAEKLTLRVDSTIMNLESLKQHGL